MTVRHKYLFSAIVLTVLFIVFVTSGSLLYAWGYRAVALLCGIPALISMGGQMFCVLMLSRRPFPLSTPEDPS